MLFRSIVPDEVDGAVNRLVSEVDGAVQIEDEALFMLFQRGIVAAWIFDRRTEPDE